MAKLFTADIDKKLFEQYKFGGDLSKQEVVAKILNPYGSGTWYLLNSDPQDPDYIWAIVDMFDVEIGSVSRNDLETMKVPPFQLHLERDKFFQPMNAQILYLRLRGGEKFEEGGEVIDRISEMVKHWNKYGWASSNINNDDSEFFKRIGKSYIDTATTSFTGNDINYYDADRVEVAGGSFKQKFATGGTTDCGCQHRMEEGGKVGIEILDDEFWKDIAFLWRSEHIDFENGRWVNTNKYKGGVNNTSNMYFTNDDADLIIGLANSYAVKLTDVKDKNPNFTAFDFYKKEFEKKRNKTYEDGGAMNYKNKFGLVKVKFKNPKYNYSTNVSANTTEKDARKYFVGQMFNVGSYPREIMREVVDIEFYEKGTYAEGGEIANSNNEMLQSQLKAVEHHAKELSSIVTDKTPVEAWVVGKIERASTDLSDITHYLDGQKFEMGGEIKNQYASKTAEQVWNEWNTAQRSHFLLDHVGRTKAEEYKDKDFDKLNDTIHVELEYHVTAGQYDKGGSIEKDTPILVGMVAENVARYKYFEKNNVPKQNEPQLIKKADETIAKLEKHLEQKANTVYKNNEMFKKQLNQKGNKGRDALYMYMEHWADAFLGKGYAKGSTMANGGILPKSEFTIQEIKEHLINEFPDSFSFALYPLKRDTKHTPDYDAVKSYKGLMDSEIKGKLKFPQYKPTHSINYGISQGGENTYFEFLLETKEDYYVGTFGFKDEGDVPANYITKFLAFLQKSYGLPFEIIHEVMAKGGVTYNTGRSWHQDRARYNKSEDWEKPFSERKMAMGGGMDELPYKSNIIVENEKYAKIVIKRHNGRILDETKEGNEYNFLVGSFDWKVLENIMQELSSKNILKSHYAKGGGIAEIDMDGIEKSAKFYTDKSRWSVPPTISKFENEITEYKELRRKLDNKEITPSKIIGTGFKPNYARPLAYKWIDERILIAKRAIELLKESGDTMAKGGKINKKYAYFALATSDNKIVNAWEIVDDIESLKYYAKLDMKDMDFKPSDYKLLSKATLIRQGIDPFNVDSWRKNEYADGGELMKHKHYDYITIQLIEPTNKGWKVKQIETHSTLGKKLSKPKEKIAYFSKDEIKDLFQPIMAMGGEVKFSDKVKAVKASLLKTKKVSPKVQKDYGKTYSPKEAEQAAKRIVGSRTAKWNERISNNK